MRKKHFLFNKTLVIGIIILFIGLSSTPSISGYIDEYRNEEFLKEYGNSSLQVIITKPTNGIYFNDHKIFPFFIPLVLCGPISIVVEVIPDGSGMDRIDFFIDGLLQETVTGSGPEYVFCLSWGPFSKINVKVIAYTLDETASDEITIWRIFN